MIEYYAPRDKAHIIEQSDAPRVFASVRAFLEYCTDCRGPIHAVKTLFRPTPSLMHLRGAKIVCSFDEVATQIDELVRESDCTYELECVFDMLDPDTRDPLPYESAAASRSSIGLALDHGNTSRLALRLRWPYSDVTDQFLRSYDATFERLPILPRSDRTYRDDSMFLFDRGALVPPPDDPVGRALHDAVLESPYQEGPRIAYADWLTERGDPLGEAMTVHVQLTYGKPTKTRQRKLRTRLRELLLQHGLRWSQKLVPR